MKKPTLTRTEQNRVIWRGLSAAARYCHVSRAHLSFVMNGTRKPSDKLMRKLAELGVTPDPLKEGVRS